MPDFVPCGFSGPTPPPAAPARTPAFILRFSDLGIPPLSREEAEFWRWDWYVANMKTADRVVLSLIDDRSRVFQLAASHSIYDYGDDFFRPPGRYQQAWTSIADVQEFGRLKGYDAAEEPGRFVGVEISMDLPHQQEVWLGRLSYGRARDRHVPPPRGRRPKVTEGRFLPADLDGDGVPEVVTPWKHGEKLWVFDPATGGYRRSPRKDALARPEALDIMVAGDLDGDGDLDLVAAESDGETLHLLWNRRGGFRGDTLRVPVPELGAILTALELADDDGDGDLDLYLGYHLMGDNAHPRLQRLEGRGKAGFAAARPVEGSGYPNLHGIYHIRLADLDGDGVLDLACLTGVYGLAAFPGLGPGRFGRRVQVAVMDEGFQRTLVVADLDGDGRLDLYAPVVNISARPEVSGNNFMLLNRGGFRFEDVTTAWGMEGGQVTGDAVMADVNGAGGPELVTLEEMDGLVAYDFDPVRRAPEEPGVRPGRLTLTDRPDSLAGAEMVFLADLDGDGTVEAVLSREDGPQVVPLPGTGPVRRVQLRRPGPNSGGIGARLTGAGPRPWSVLRTSTHRGGTAPFLVAAGERLSVQGFGPPAEAPPGLPGDRVTVTPGRPPGWRGKAAAIGSWARWRLPTWSEIPRAAAREPGARAAAGLAAAAGLILLGAGIRRRRRVRDEERMWRELLSVVGFSSHAHWRLALAGVSRAARAVRAGARNGGGEAAVPADPPFREYLPPEVLARLRRAVEVAWELGLEGARTADRAIRELERVCGEEIADPERLLEAGSALRTSLTLIQGPLVERFSCAPAEVLERVVRFRTHHGGTGPVPVCEIEDSDLGRRFPLSAADAFACLDEFLANAGKKVPVPGTIRVTVAAQGPKVAVLGVWDDGASVEAEWARDGRPGSRSGLTRLNQILAAYGGKARITDAPGGGVRAEVRVPRFDNV